MSEQETGCGRPHTQFLVLDWGLLPAVVDEGIAGGLPGAEAAVQVVHVGVAHLHQGAGGDGAHPTAAAIDDDLDILILWQLVGEVGDLVEGDEGIGALDLAS